MNRLRLLRVSLGAAFLLALLGSRYLFHRVPGPGVVTTVIAPGLTLTQHIVTGPEGPRSYCVVHAKKAQGWRLGVALAGTSGVDKAPVAAIAAPAGTAVAANGSYFFYSGPAVGPLKTNGTWRQLPWSDRTSLGLDAAGQPHIGLVSGSISLKWGRRTLPVHALNGNPDNASAVNEVNIYTPTYGPDYLAAPDEAVWIVTNGTASLVPAPTAVPTPRPVAVPVGSTVGIPAPTASQTPAQPSPSAPPPVPIPANGFLVVGNGTAAALLGPGSPSGSPAIPVFTAASGPKPVQSPVAASFTIQTAPPAWNSYPTILGGGPRLLHNGKVQTTEAAEHFRADVIGPGPRVAIGVAANHDLILLAVEGWSSQYSGVTLQQAAQLLQQEGAVEAMSLDGGASESLVVNGVQVAGHPQTPVANAIVIMRPGYRAPRDGTPLAPNG